MPLQHVSFESQTSIRYQFQLDTFDKENTPRRVIIAKFCGDYRPGSQGTPDALFIQGITQGVTETAGQKILNFEIVLLEVMYK